MDQSVARTLMRSTYFFLNVCLIKLSSYIRDCQVLVIVLIMKCDSCNVLFTDGVQCGVCKKHFDFTCANITEAGYRKLGPDRRAAWKCPSCRIAAQSPAHSPSRPPVTLETIQDQLYELKSQLTSLPTLINDVKSIKQEVTDLKLSCEFTCNKVDEFASKLDKIDKRILELEKLKDELCTTKTALTKLQNEHANRDQWTRLNNVEIKGVPLKKDENLFNIVGAISKRISYEFPKSQINYISRVPMHNTKDKLILLSFVNRYVKEEFIAAARSTKCLSATDIGFEGNDRRIFVNDHLTPDSKKLLTAAKTIAKEKNYQYIWVKFAKIHVRKNNTSSSTIIINSLSDLNKLV